MGAGMGLGFRIDQRGGRPFFCHAGDGVGFTAFIGGHPEEGVGVALLMNTGDAQEARSVIVRRALESVLGEPASSAGSRGPIALPPTGGYRSTYWGVRVHVDLVDDVPILTTSPGSISSVASAGRLTPHGARWRADGGMFDGCELDFEFGEDGRRFSGGMYPFEFVADDARVIAVPAEVDETGDLRGTWTGTIETPLGSIPLELDVLDGEQTVRLRVMGAEGTDTGAVTHSGRVHARFALDVLGFGSLTAFARLGLVGASLEGLLFVRTDAGELSFPSALVRV
jgi:hypothetical protein